MRDLYVERHRRGYLLQGQTDLGRAWLQRYYPNTDGVVRMPRRDQQRLFGPVTIAILTKPNLEDARDCGLTVEIVGEEPPTKRCPHCNRAVRYYRCRRKPPPAKTNKPRKYRKRRPAKKRQFYLRRAL